MKIEKETKVIIEDDNGVEIRVGDTVALHTQNGVLVGKFLGFIGKGAMAFASPIKDISCTIHIMPNSIQQMYKVKLEVVE